MFYLLYHSNNILGVFRSLNAVESTISSLVHNKLTKVSNFNVIEYSENITSVGTNVNNILRIPLNINSESNENSTLVDKDIFEKFSDNETTEEYNYDSTEVNEEEEIVNEVKEVVEETQEQKEKRIRRETIRETKKISKLFQTGATV